MAPGPVPLRPRKRSWPVWRRRARRVPSCAVPAPTRLVVLAKPPCHGRSKSRLAASLGPGPAARLARAFLLDTWADVSSFVSAHSELDLVFAQAGNTEDFPLLLPTPTVVRQGEGDLGRRMATLAAGALSQRERALLLGTDSPSLPDEHRAAAVAALDKAQIVLGPNADGGFWCLGVRAGHQALRGNTWLDDLDWSVDQTLVQVEQRAARMGFSVAHAPPWFDVDRESDLPRLQASLDDDPERAPETRAALRAPLAQDGLISVIITTLNENIRLDECLRQLAGQPGPTEIVVADGGSSDRSPERAAATGAVVTVTPPGRGRQLAAGAALASADVFLFLHCDGRLPPGALDAVRDTLGSGEHEAGAFVTRTVADDDLPNYCGPLLRLADLRSRFTRHPYGDQAMFMTRAAYEAAGGFRKLPIMEDYDLSVRLAARKPLARVLQPVQVSGRRIQTRPLRSAVLMRLIPPLYRMGVNPQSLARFYHRW